MMEQFLEIERNLVISDLEKESDQKHWEGFKKGMYRLESGEPLQYVLGKSTFLGLELKVDPSVLIPRPETEELVDWLLEKNIEQKKRVLDIGTGSGCIPLALKKSRPDWQVLGMDISKKALEIAEENAAVLGLPVEFFQDDILQDPSDLGKFDLIVSNPPYVSQEEKNEMRQNVLDHEPRLALFPEGTDPLIFYRKIIEYSLLSLNSGGSLFFELNEGYWEETRSLFLEGEWKSLEVKKDIFGKYRMLSAVRS